MLLNKQDASINIRKGTEISNEAIPKCIKTDKDKAIHAAACAPIRVGMKSKDEKVVISVHRKSDKESITVAAALEALR